MGQYLERVGLEEGYLVLFDRRKGVGWEEKLFERTVEHRGRHSRVWHVSAGEWGRRALVPSEPIDLAVLAVAFPLSWSHYVRLLSLWDEYARRFYETEALRGAGRCGHWNGRSIPCSSITALSKNKAAMLTKGAKARPEDALTPEEEIKSPYVLEFLALKDEYSEAYRIHFPLKPAAWPSK